MISNNLSKKLQVKKKKGKGRNLGYKKKLFYNYSKCVYINIVTAKSPKLNSIETQS